MKTIHRGADTRVRRVVTPHETPLNAFRCWKYIAVSLKACLGLFLLAATAHAS